MPAERYYTPYPLQEGLSVFLEDKEWHHLRNVMRAAIGDELELVNGHGDLAEGVVTKLEKQRAEILVRKTQRQPKARREIILAQAIPRMNRLDFIIEKGTELGMTQLWLFPGRHSERQKLTEQQLAHQEFVCISALKQCGRLYLPKIKIVEPIQKWLRPPYEIYYGDVNPQAPLFLDTWKRAGDILFVIGPESGLHEDEEARLSELGAKGVKLHANILRTDTAAITALALATHENLDDTIS